MRTYLNYKIDTEFRHGADAPTELNGISRMPPPVFAVNRLARRNRAAGYIADQTNRRRRDLHGLVCFLQFVQCRLYQRAVECLISEPPHRDFLGLELL